MGVDSVVIAVGRGTITFQRESMSPMVLREVLYVPGLKKNLVSVSMIEDQGLGVSFLDGHVHMSLKTVGPSASVAIGVRCGKLYRLLFQPQHGLAHSSGSELCELWHRRMAHLHHPALGFVAHLFRLGGNSMYIRMYIIVPWKNLRIFHFCRAIAPL